MHDNDAAVMNGNAAPAADGAPGQPVQHILIAGCFVIAGGVVAGNAVVKAHIQHLGKAKLADGQRGRTEHPGKGGLSVDDQVPGVLPEDLIGFHQVLAQQGSLFFGQRAGADAAWVQIVDQRDVVICVAGNLMALLGNGPQQIGVGADMVGADEKGGFHPLLFQHIQKGIEGRFGAPVIKGQEQQRIRLSTLVNRFSMIPILVETLEPPMIAVNGRLMLPRTASTAFTSFSIKKPSIL